jgi:hypothetical protein
MAGADTNDVPQDLVRAEMECILASDCFRPSGVLRNLLAFLVNTTLAGETDQIKEYTIAVQVLGQPASFDSRLNNVVRVHVHRLRERLRKYYSQEGSHAQILIELPVGSYVPQFSPKLAAPPAEAPNAAAGAPTNPPRLPLTSRRWLLPIAVALGLAAGLIAGAGFHSALNRPATTGPNSTALKPFWEPLWNAKIPTVLALANRKFLLDDSGNYLVYYGPKTGLPGTWMNSKADLEPYVSRKCLDATDRLQFNDALTGVGEAESIHVLTELFDAARSPVTLRKGRLLRLEDLRANNVVFLGSPVGHPLMDRIVRDLGLDFWGQGIVVRNQPSHPPFNAERDPSTGTLLRDYGLIARLPGPGPNTRIVILAGNWTYGTLAATRFVTDPAGVAALLAYPGMTRSGKLPEYFEAVVQGEIVQEEIGTVRLMFARPLQLTSPGVQ